MRHQKGRGSNKQKPGWQKASAKAMEEGGQMRYKALFVGGLVLLAASFSNNALRVDAQSADEKAVSSAYRLYIEAFRAKDINKILSLYVPDDSLVVFDAVPPRQYVGLKAFHKDYEGFFAVFPGP